MNGRQLDYAQFVASAARQASDGAPGAVKAVGRLFGLGQNERDALARGGVPGWAWAALGLGVGIIAGVRIHKSWPNKVPKFIAGG